MALLALLTIFQRGIGFVRGVLFCRWLPEEQLGQWDLVFGFLMLAGPLVVLGIPGSFGRYVEYFRQRGQLRTFLWRTTTATLVFSVAGCLLLWIFDQQAAIILFKDASFASIIPWVTVTLAMVIGFNYFVEMFIAMRQMRTVSALQFMNSAAFAVVGLGLLHWYEASAKSVVIAYGVACLATVLLGIWTLNQDWRNLPMCQEVPGQSVFWKKLLPFAAWLWAINLLSNLFEIVDRYMIVHFSGLAPEQSLALVGDYHSSRIVPWLMVAVAGLFGGILLPHLSADWEAGRRDHVSRQINLILKMGSLLLTGCGIAIGLFAPLLFHYVFEGKYEGGLTVLPWTLTYCAIYSLSGLVMLYFCCAEKTRAGAIVYGVGLVANVILNAILLPRLGLQGAVMATAFANVVAIALAAYLANRMEMQFQWATLGMLAIPICLGIGIYFAMAVVIVLLWQTLATHRLFDEEDKRAVQAGIQSLTQRFAR